MDFKWYAKAQMVTLLLLALLASVSFSNYWKDTESNWNYHAIVKTRNGESVYYNIWKYCAGVVVNTYYVLTVFKCTRNGRFPISAKDLRIEITQPKGRLDDESYGHQAGDYVVEEIWDLHSLSLLRSATPFKLAFGKCGIELPKGGQLDLWKTSFNMPNKEEIISHKWCLGKGNFHKFHISKGIRNCTDDQIYNTPTSLFQSCLQHNTNSSCILPEGTPLIYNNILIGIKMYSGASPPPPYNNFKHDLFMNIIEEVPYLEKHMINYTQCAP